MTTVLGFMSRNSVDCCQVSDDNNLVLLVPAQVTDAILLKQLVVIPLGQTLLPETEGKNVGCNT